MTGIKIPVSADVSGVNDAMNALVAKAKQLNSTLSSGKATLDVSGAKKAMGDLERLADNLHKQLEKAGSAEVGGDALDGLSGQFESAIKEAQELAAAMAAVGVQSAGGFSKSATATRALIREMERARQLQKVMQREGQTLPLSKIRAAERNFQGDVTAGVPGSRKFRNNNGLGAVLTDWQKLGMNETDARRQRNALIKRYFGDSGGGGGAGGGGAPAPGGQRGFASFMGGTASRAGRSALSAAMPNMGVGGSIMHSAVSEAAATEGGMLSGGGLARLAGGAAIGGAAFLGVKAIGAIKSKVNSAESEGTGYADMSRSMGAVTTDFNELRNAIRGAVSGMGLAYEEGQKFAAEYERHAWTMSPSKLGTEVRGAVGFSRSMGLDPSHGVDFFSTMRGNKVSSGDADNRRIALMLADAIGKAGVFNKADEVLQAVSSFTVQATRASFTKANIGGYTGGMTSLINTGLPGMDPSAAASLLNKADSAIRSPGSLAVQNFMLGMGQEASPDMNARDLGLLTDGGAFGTMEGQFGDDSVAQASTNEPGLKAHYKKLAKDGGKTTNIERIMKRAKQYGLGDDWTRTNLKDILHMSDSEAASFMAADRQGGGIGKSMEAFKADGFDVDKMAPTAVKGIMTARYGDNDARRAQAKYLQGLTGDQKLNDKDSAALKGALATPGDKDSELKKVLERLVSTRDMEMTDGDRSRQSMADISNATTQFATKLIPIAIAIREGVVGLAKHFGYTDTVGNSEKAQAALDAGPKDGPGRREALGKLRADVRDNKGNYTPEFRAEVERMFDAESAGAPEGGQGGADRRGGFAKGDTKLAAQARQIAKDSLYDDTFKKAAKKYGVDWKDLKQLGVQESGLRASAINYNKNGTVDHGIMQLNSRFDDERGISNPNDPEQNIMGGAGVWARALRDAKGNKREAFRRYNGSGPAAEAYADRAMQLNGMIDAPSSIPLPAGASSAPPSMTHNVRIGGSAEVRVRMPDGSAQSVPFNVTQMGSPKVSGAGSPFAGAMQ